MASNPDFVQYIADQCGGAGVIVTRKMFGDVLHKVGVAGHRLAYHLGEDGRLTVDDGDKDLHLAGGRHIGLISTR